MGTAIPQFRARGHQPRTGPVAVAFLGRTSTATAQDPVESLAKQLRLARERLPEGFCITRYYWDVESGGIDLDARSRTGIWQQFAAAGIPRDGGMADLRAAIAEGNPPFTAAICENIERAGRDMYDALRLEKELGTAGIPIFATDEPIDADASHGSTLLVRRTKQGVAEYFRYNLKTQMWEGLRQYVIGGFNTGQTPYGYLADRTIHPNPMKASMGATRARLVPDPERGPWVTRIYEWRVYEKLSVPGIARRLTEQGAPSPDGKAWSPSTVDTILRNPKYTGRVVLGRTTNTGPTARKGERKVRHLPRDYWTWADESNAPPRPGPGGAVGSRPGDRPAARQRPRPRHPRPSAAAAGTPTAPGSGAASASAACTASPAPAAAPASPRPMSTTCAPPRPPTPATPRTTPATSAHRSPNRPSPPPCPTASTSTRSATTAPPCSPSSSRPPPPSSTRPTTPAPTDSAASSPRPRPRSRHSSPR